MAATKIWHFWAKSGDYGAFHPLPAHLLDVAAVGHAFLETRPAMRREWAETFQLNEDELGHVIGWGLAVHDIGKFSARFQAKHEPLFRRLHGNQSLPTTEPHHTTLGSLLLREQASLATVFGDGHPWGAKPWRHVLDALEPPFTGHHGQPPEAKDYGFSIWDPQGLAAANEWLRQIAVLFPMQAVWRHAPPPKAVVNALRAASWHLAGFAVVCDWIGSNPRWFRVGDVPSQDLPTYWESALQRARTAIKESGLMPAAIAPPESMASMFKHDATPLQSALEAWSPSPGANLVMIEDTTGAGKTEASLLAAHRVMAVGGAEGFYFALPTQATANAMFKRVQFGARCMFADPDSASLVLAHGGRVATRAFREDALHKLAEAPPGTRDEGILQCAAWLADSRKKAFLAHLGVGTIDQALLGVLRVKHQSMRLFGLTSRVLIVDEVHAYDPYATLLLERLITFHAGSGCSIILLSATMPQSLRQRLGRAFAAGAGREGPALSSTSYPLLTTISTHGDAEIPVGSRSGSERTISIRFVHDAGDVLQTIRQAAAQGQCVCWIRNTVAEALEAWDALRDDGAVLFHARFTEGDRSRIEAEVLAWAGVDSTPQQRRGRILIATQVVEQSLDVDFDVLITDLAPIDLLIQRAGRLQRHQGRARPGNPPTTLHVFAPAWSPDPDESWVRDWSPGTSAVYPDHGRLWLSCEALRRTGTIRVPAMLRGLVDHVYGDAAAKGLPAGLTKSTHRAEQESLADSSHARLHVLPLADGYRARDAAWDDPDRARTRAGEASVDLYLATRRDGQLIPLNSSEGRWEDARVRITLALARKTGLLEAPPPVGTPRWVNRVLVLAPHGEGEWRAETHASNPYFLSYAIKAGLRTAENEKHESDH